MENLKSYLSELMDGKNLEEQVEILNTVKLILHELSPLKNEPVDCVLWVKNNLVEANDYNPNNVAPPEMRLLEHSIMADGYTQPVVTFKKTQDKTIFENKESREVVDGFHRTRVGKESKEVRERVHGYIPVVTINQHREEKGDRIAATIRHNRARGKHRIDAMAEIVIELKRRNWSDKKIGSELGMDPDEVLRLCQITGLAEMFSDQEFSEAWEADQIFEDDSLEIETNE